MKRVWRMGFLALLLTAPAAPAAVKPTPSHRAPRFDAVTLLIRHRVFHDFADEQRVQLNKDFVIGDTDFKARVVQYVPDFMMDLKSRKIVSRTEHPNNPAFKIIVWKKKVPQDTTWALLNLPPHFARKSMLAFRAVRIDFLDRPPMYPDTTKDLKMAPPIPSEKMQLPEGHKPMPTETKP
jgi:hypothetical protein